MKVYITLFFSFLFTFECFSQDLNSLNKFTGTHDIDRIIDYTYKDNEWILLNTVKGGYINFGLDRTWFKRDLQEWLAWDLQFIGFDKINETYMFESKYGNMQVEKDFKKIIFYDLEKKNKYVYYISQTEKINNTGITQTVFYDENYRVVPNRTNAIYYATYTKDEKGNIIDYIRFYDIKENYLLRKYKGFYISNISLIDDIVDGELTSYDKYGNIRRKTFIINPNKIQLFKYLETKNDIIYDFDTRGNLIQYTEFQNGEESKIVKYDNNQDIIYANDKNDKYFYQGNPSAGYELTYNEEFEVNRIFNMNVRDYSLGKTSYTNNGYLMESRNDGGIADVLDINFDMNNTDWVITSTFDRVSSIQGAGVVIGSSEEGTNVQMFLVSGDSYFNHYNIYNGFNISSLKDWMYSDNIKGGYSRNILSIMKMNDKIFVSINGKNTFQSDFTPLSTNTVGFFVDKRDNKINFQNLIIKKLNSSIPSKFYNPKTYISTESKFKGNGSGFLINTSGYIATNYHVIDGATEIFTEINGKDYKCKLVAVDKENDLAIIKVIDKNNFIIYSTITSNKTETGSEVFVLGFPYALSLLGNEIKLTDGKVSSQSGFQGESKTYQISAPIQPGNSGGPLFNTDGNIVGIVSSKFTGGENVGYAIKSDYLLKFLAKNNLTYEKTNSIKHISLVEKIKSLSETTFLIKTK
ncbi:S1C family serine protease [Flavobacteriales bacterium]|nr:S1C family serine protease [Flavobacteriales bacterium]